MNNNDPRTGVPFGVYSEEEIEKEVAKIGSVETLFGTYSEGNSGDRVFQDMVATADSRVAPVKADIATVVSGHYRYMDLMSKANSLASQIQSVDDVEALTGSLDLFKQGKAERAKLPERYDNFGIVHEIVRATTEGLATYGHMAKQMAPDVTATTLAGAATGAAYGAMGSNPLTMAAGAIAGAGAGFKAGIVGAGFEQARVQGKGEILLQLIDPEGEKPIPIVVAVPIAEAVSQLYGASEMLGAAGVVSGALGIGKGLMERFLSITGEGVTEFSQTLMEQTARFFAEKKMAGITGADLDKEFEDYLDWAEAHQAARQGMLGAVGMQSPSMAIDMARKGHRATEILMRQKDNKDAIRASQIAAAKEAEAASVIEQKAEQQQTSTNTLVENPIVKEEIAKVEGDKAVPGTDITDAEIGDLVLNQDDEDIQSSVDALMSRLGESVSDRTIEFMSGVYEALPIEQAQLYEGLIEARAKASGRSLSQYIDDRKLAFEVVDVDHPFASAEVAFTKENEAILTMYKQGDLVSAVHEIGHVFRRDLVAEEAQIADDFVGAKRGAKWNREQEEKFAEAFEQYVFEGKAPTGLESIFKRLSEWFVAVYQATRANSPGIEITPELRSVFDKMLYNRDGSIQQGELTSDEQANQKYNEIKEERAIQQRVQKAIEEEVLYASKPRYTQRTEDTLEGDVKRDETYGAYVERVTNDYTKETGKKNLTGKELTALQAKALVRAMQRMFDAGDIHGYNMAKAMMKAFLYRERARFTTYRKHALLKKNIFKKLKKGLPARRAGKSYTKLDPAKAEYLLRIRAVLTKAANFKGAKEMYEQRVAEGFFDPHRLVDPEDAFISSFLRASVARTPATVKELAALNRELAQEIKEARAFSPAAKMRQAREQIKPLIIEEVRGIDSVMAEEHGEAFKSVEAREVHKRRQSSKWNGIVPKREWFATNTKAQSVLGGLMSNIRNISMYSGKAEPILARLFNFYDAKQRKLTETRKLQENIISIYSQIFDLNGKYDWNTTRKVYDKWKSDLSEKLDIGWKIALNRSQVRYLWMLKRDTTLTDRLVNMGIDDTVWQNVETTLTDQDKRFAEHLISYFNDDRTYSAINKVYKKLFGVNLNRYDYYIPLSAFDFTKEQIDWSKEMGNAQAAIDAMFRGEDPRRTPTSAGSLKSRSEKVDKVPLALMGDISVFTSYTQEMAHFKHYAEQAQMAGGILKDNDFRRAVTIEYGDKILKTLDTQFDNVIADGANARDLNQYLDAVRSAFIVSKIALAGMVLLKQQISGIQYMEYMPTAEFVKGLSTFWLNPVKNIQVIYSSEYGKNRRMQIDRDVSALMNSSEYGKWRINPVLSNFLTLNVRVGDSLAIAIFGWSYYNYLTSKKGLSSKEAIKLVGRISEQTQQSGMMQEQSLVHTGGSYARFFSMFSSGPVQAARKELQAIRDYASGRITLRQFSKTMLIYHILVPAMFASLVPSSGDEERDKKSFTIAVGLGPFGAAYSMGELITWLANTLIGGSAYNPGGIGEDMLRDIGRVGSKMVKDEFEDLSLEDWASMSEAVLNIAGRKAPITRAVKIGENLAQGDITGAMLGSTPEDED